MSKLETGCKFAFDTKIGFPTLVPSNINKFLLRVNIKAHNHIGEWIERYQTKNNVPDHLKMFRWDYSTERSKFKT
jgi:hypothetical protein